MRPPCKMDIQLLEPRDGKNECNAIRRCGGHVYQFTRLDDAKWIATHRFNGGPVEIIANAVAAQIAYNVVMEHHRNTHQAG